MGRLPLRVLVVALTGIVVGIVPTSAWATQKFGPLELSGNLQSANLVRTPDADHYQFIMNRNIAHIRLDYDWLVGGKFYNKYDIPFLEKSHLFLLYRGVYDSVYDTRPGFIQKEDIHGRAYPGGTTLYQFAKARRFSRQVLELNGLPRGALHALRFENALREAYVDVKLRGIPLTIRAGRQQIVWGETDNFRMLDRANSLDLTWHQVQEIPAPAYGWDEIRRPFWMIKFLYELGDVWKFSQSFLEWYWNPGDWYPVKMAFIPRPWGLPFMNPLTNPVDGVFIGGVCGTSSIKAKAGPNAGQGICTRLMNGTKLFERGDWSRNPFDNSQVGVRYHGIMPFGLEFTLNYFYQRWAGDDGTDSAPLRGIPKITGNPATDPNQRLTGQLEARGIFPAEYFAPYVHTLGFSANYSDETYTQTVFRAETVYDVGIPFFDAAKETTVDVPPLPGITKKNMWKGMIAFDRPTWIRTLNKKSTVFLTGQFFWHYIVNYPDCNPQIVANLPSAAKKRVGSCLVGALDLPSQFRPRAESFRDKVREWETLFTLAGFTFYRGGSIVPVMGVAVNPSNHWVMEPFWTVDYVVRDDFVVNLAQRYFVTPTGHSTPIFETFGLGGLNNNRSETELRLTYQF